MLISAWPEGCASSDSEPQMERPNLYAPAIHGDGCSAVGAAFRVKHGIADGYGV